MEKSNIKEKNIVFFGRQAEMDLLEKKLNDLKDGYRQNVAILGKKNIGKTALIFHFLRNIKNTQAVPIYLDPGNLNFTGFCNKFIGMLLYYGTNLNAKIAESDDLLKAAEIAQKDIPVTSKLINKILRNRESADKTAIYSRLLDLPLHFSQETGRLCVVIFDDFKNMTKYKIKDPFAVLGEKIMVQKQCLYVLSGLPDHDSLSILSDRLSLLFGKFYTMYLKPLKPFEALEFIRQRLNNIEIPHVLREFLIHITNSEPFYLDALTGSFVLKCAELKIDRIPEEEFTRILTESVVGKYSAINFYFTNMTEKISLHEDLDAVLCILNAVVYENKIFNIVKRSGYPRKLVIKIVEKFIANHLIIKNGPLYALANEMFCLWVKANQTTSNRQFSLDQLSPFDVFDTHLEKYINNFKVQKSKADDDKIVNLITAFDNEKVTVNKKTHILPMFKHIRSELSDQDNFILSGHGSKLWLFSAYKRLITENDVLNFLKYNKCRNHKVSRRVLIAFCGISSEAKLFAMQEGLWIWPLDNLNNLLNLYRKPRINTTNIEGTV